MTLAAHYGHDAPRASPIFAPATVVATVPVHDSITPDQEPLRHAHAECRADRSGVFGLEGGRGGAVGAEPGGDGGERRHREHVLLESRDGATATGIPTADEIAAQVEQFLADLGERGDQAS
jgi:hypothetical protein